VIVPADKAKDNRRRPSAGREQVELHGYPTIY
jgi:hypothetical protein